MWIRDARASKGMTQAEVAARSGIARAAYGNIEKQKRRPSVEVAKRISEVLGFEWTRFYEEGERIATPVCAPARNDGSAEAKGA